MTHIANQRIKKGGKYYTPGDPITLSEDELKALPEGAVILDDAASKDEDANSISNSDPDGLQLTDEFRLRSAIEALTEADFKKDGTIREDSLKRLNEELGFEVTAETVTKVLAAEEHF